MSETTYVFHSELNPLVWDGEKIKPEIKQKLLEITTIFLEHIDIDFDTEDITLTGSLANYTYTEFSDFDLHIITDFKQYKQDLDLIKDYFNAKKTVWNLQHDIKIKNHSVEMYIQDIDEPHFSNGVYSLRNDVWIIRPTPATNKIDQRQVLEKKQTILDMIEFGLSDQCDIELAEKIKKKLTDYRRAGLQQAGDLSPENLAFKELRRSGELDKFMKGIASKQDKKLSLDSINENVKTFADIINNKRGPRHQMPTFGANKLGQTDKTIGVVAQWHKKLPKDTLQVHQFKKQPVGFGPINPAKAQEIINRYKLDINRIKAGEPRKLSTSGIEIGFNPQTGSFFLRKAALLNEKFKPFYDKEGNVIAIKTELGQTYWYKPGTFDKQKASLPFTKYPEMGILHRLDGPAIDYGWAEITPSYYVNGKHVTKYQHDQLKKAEQEMQAGTHDAHLAVNIESFEYDQPEPAPDFENEESFGYNWTKHVDPEAYKRGAGSINWFKKDGKFNWQRYISNGWQLEQSGTLHNVEGPAVVYGNNYKTASEEYWVDGKRYNHEDWLVSIHLRKGKQKANMDINIESIDPRALIELFQKVDKKALAEVIKRVDNQLITEGRDYNERVTIAAINRVKKYCEQNKLDINKILVEARYSFRNPGSGRFQKNNWYNQLGQMFHRGVNTLRNKILPATGKALATGAQKLGKGVANVGKGALNAIPNAAATGAHALRAVGKGLASVGKGTLNSLSSLSTANRAGGGSGVYTHTYAGVGNNSYPIDKMTSLDLSGYSSWKPVAIDVNTAQQRFQLTPQEIQMLKSGAVLNLRDQRNNIVQFRYKNGLLNGTKLRHIPEAQTFEESFKSALKNFE